MSGRKPPKQQPPNKNQNLDPNIIQDFLDVQKEKISRDKYELELKREHIKQQHDLATRTLDIQAKILLKEPDQKRKERRQTYFFVFFLVIILFGFCGFCLIYGHTEFLKYFMGTVTHLFTLGLGYYFGVKKEKNKDSASDYIQDAEIVD